MGVRRKGGRGGPDLIDKSRRIFCRSTAFTLAALASPAFAQDQWWEKFPGFKGSEEPRTAANDDRRRPEALNDLRPDRVPLRSQEMVEALEDAIQRYQQIVSNGGWPAIPGTRPIRPEDNDERVGLLLQAAGDQRRVEGPAQPDPVRHRLLRRTGSRRAALPGKSRPARHRPGGPAHAAGPEHFGAGPPGAAQDQSAASQGSAVAETGRSLCAGERCRVPARGGRAAPGGAAPSRDRRQARAADADRARNHQGAQFLPLLARARKRGARSISFRASSRSPATCSRSASAC